jgi:hypothetical protein
MQFGSMSWREWTRMFFPPKRPKVKQAKQTKYKKELSMFVAPASFNGNDRPISVSVSFLAYTKGEARAMYKRKFGKIPPGTVFEKVA